MDVLIFDLDNTLYPPERELFKLIDVRINHYMTDIVEIPDSEVDNLRRKYWSLYGVTLQGLIRHHGVDPEEYLAYVHDVDVSSRLQPDPVLRQALLNVPQRKAVFTNGSICHAARVLAALDIEDLFEAVFDIRIAGYLPKPNPDPYLAVLATLETEADLCIMVEDSRDNLRTAKSLGMGTVLVGAGKKPSYVDVHLPNSTHISQGISFWKRYG